uniref:Uncharacterized protein LOC111122063 isoform X2 n=1 Tax=Crassostrea virginica TaxID=6565 RepID=A0A8B8CU26_CRAVI|nr:uncharacterized protein LOC111122063 isoform X2 [Crassostrea virginica]
MFVSYKKFSHYPVIFAFICGKITNANVINTVAGEHCTTNNLTENLGNKSKCVTCFFPQNCLANNLCIEGTTGDTCEQCLCPDFYRLGNTCIYCEAVPVTTIVFGIYLLLLLMAVITNGFTNSLCTKLKIICHFFQMLYLTSLIKIQWPGLIQKAVIGLAFVTFNSNVIPIKCLIPSISFLNIHYLEWCSSFLIVTIVCLIILPVDKSLRSVIRDERDDDLNPKRWRRRVTFLRVAFFVLLVMYMPVTLSVIHSSLCSGIVPAEVTLKTDKKRSVFFYLQNESCTQVIFQFFGTVFLLFFVLLLPVLIIFVALRQKRWRLLSTLNHQHRPLYESYHHRCCYWEAFPMFRKLISIAVTDVYPLSVFVQCLFLLSTTGLYFILLILLRPYSPVVWGNRKTEIHTFFEIQANLTVGLMQALPLLLTLGISSPTLEYLILGCMALTTLIGVLMIFITPMEKEEDTQISPSEGNLGSPSSHRWCNRVAPAPQTFEEEIELRKRHLDF